MFAKPKDNSHYPVVEIVALALLVLLLFTIDWCTRQINISILYVIPLIIYAHVRRCRGIWYFALLLSLLTYGKYIHNHFDQFTADPLKIVNSHIWNRTFSVCAILFTAVLLKFWRRRRDHWMQSLEGKVTTGSDIMSQDRVVKGIDQFVVVLVAIVIVIALVLADFLTPGEINIPILYLAPLALLATTMNRTLLWCFVPIVLILNFLGYVYGPPPTVESSLLKYLVTNRFISAFTLIACAVVFHLWIGGWLRAKAEMKKHEEAFLSGGKPHGR